MTDQTARERDELGLSHDEVRNTPAASRLRLRLYVGTLLIFPFALIAFGLWLMGSNWLRRHNQDPYLASIGYGERLVHANCQIVIYGDSTAMADVDPLLLEERTGLTACDIAEIEPIQMVNGTAVLDEYLKHNEKPRYLVFVDTPEDLSNPPQWEFVGAFEGVYYRLRDHPEWGVARMMLSHPIETINSSQTILWFGARWAAKKPLKPEELAFRDKHHGHMPDVGQQLEACTSIYERRAPEARWLQSLRDKYGSPATRVLIDVTPLPPCAPTLQFYRDTFLPGMVDNGVKTQPITTYTSGGRLHMTHAGIEMMSIAIADQIIQAEKEAR